MTTETDDEKRIRVHALWQAKLEADPWNGWRALLNNWDIEGVKVPVSPEHPFTGYYRSKNQDKTFDPVAYWYEGDKLVCLRRGREQPIDRAIESWKYVSRYPISHTWYKAVAEEGKPWPDADKHVTSEALAKSAEAPAAEDFAGKNPQNSAGIGHNKPPEETPRVALHNQIVNALGGVADYKTIKNDTDLAKARSLKNRLTELAGLADKARKAEKEPHWLRAKAVDEEWMPEVKLASEGAAEINTAENAYATEQLKARRADEQRAEKERAEADRVRIANEAKTQHAEETGTEAELEKVPEVRPAALPAADTTVRPGYGRAANIKTEWIVTGITDIDALFAFLKTHVELKQKMIELAQRALKAGLDPAGVSKEERAKVR